ncbi:MAG: sulfurtransferase TusA family protein [Rhodospirillaceae bacterium]|jgi:tRNA 2-thiouridine synthesizing protein A|nr:sulfurtransferase TusA family protein [Rhodospirillaceae bacterium]MBT3886773.1 sulfurtransferase TusA family protein [Rhodospirillaceae bacterium]MBT4116438.1 sulfurtransferase TusA family protein [Rhodospirillaceae bacterium]MBT4671776.1 sulfurtransferase TusA family protein [Rhodospirillaceae bacterium]MBT4717877.1 sulfurtransferase TusA family protein [Rhodospirillaceae bacterium]
MPTELDAKGMNCPMPILKAKKALMQLEANDTLRIEATDPGSVADFDAFCRNGGHTLEESSEDGGVYTYLIRKAS